jgi:GT2 family glycosyltransferase
MAKKEIVTMTDPKVFVLILTYNNKYLLEDSISSYLNNNYSNFQVVVIDNGSVDGTKEFVEEKFPEAAIIRLEKNQGYSGGFNFGLDYAFNQKNADYALVTNNDVKADTQVITELVKVAAKDKKNGFCTGKVFYFDQPNILQTVGKRSHPIRWNGGNMGTGEEDTGQYDKESERDFSDDIYTLVRRELYQEVGGYDTTFFLQCEEYDWQARAKALGYKIMYTPHAKIWHKESVTIGKTSPLKEYYNARNPMLVILKHKSPGFFRKYFWLHFRKDIIKFSAKVVLKNLEINKAIKIWAGFFSGIYWGIKHRKFTLKHFFLNKRN